MKIKSGRRGGWLLILVIIVTASFAFFYFNMLKSKRSEQVLAVSYPKESVFKPLLKPLIFEPKLISIPSISLKDVKVVEVGVEEDGRLEVPKSYKEVGWYKNGPRAGEDGNAILAGHYDSPGGGPAVFYSLVGLKSGEVVEIQDVVGKKINFKVYEVSYVEVSDPEAVLKAYEETKDPILTLITCGGVWDPIAKDYNKRLLIKAKKDRAVI